MRKVICGFLLGISGIFLCATVIRAQTFDFTYQGRLLNGTTPATGSYDFEFTFYDDIAAGTNLGTIVRQNVSVAGGVFTVRLGFGGNLTGEPRFLEIRAGVAGSGNLITLSPRL